MQLSITAFQLRWLIEWRRCHGKPSKLDIIMMNTPTPEFVIYHIEYTLTTSRAFVVDQLDLSRRKTHPIYNKYGGVRHRATNYQACNNCTCRRNKINKSFVFNKEKVSKFKDIQISKLALPTLKTFSLACRTCRTKQVGRYSHHEIRKKFYEP